MIRLTPYRTPEQQRRGRIARRVQIVAVVAALILMGIFALTPEANATPEPDDLGVCEGAPEVLGHEWQQQRRTREHVPAVEEVKHKEWRFQTRTPLYGSKEVKEVKGYDFVDGGSVRVNGQTISGHWVASAGWHVIPDSIINAVWGESGVPEQYLGTGRVSLSSYGGPNVTVDYKAHKVTTDEGFTEWGPWSDWSTTNPGGSTETRNVDSRWVVTVEAVPAHYTAWSEWADHGEVVRTDEHTDPALPADTDVIEHRWVYVGTYVRIEAAPPSWQDTDPEGECYTGPEPEPTPEPTPDPEPTPETVTPVDPQWETFASWCHDGQPVPGEVWVTFDDTPGVTYIDAEDPEDGPLNGEGVAFTADYTFRVLIVADTGYVLEGPSEWTFEVTVPEPVECASLPEPPVEDEPVTPDLPELPETGATSGALAVIAAVLVAVGGIFYRINRRIR